MTSRLAGATTRERLLWGTAVAVVIAIGFILIGAHDHRYFYIDDTESGAVGNWIQLGHIMRDGHFPSLVLDSWMAGNYPVEGQGGLWNPVQMLINYIAPSVDNLALLAAGVKLIFSIILGWGIYRVAIEYGAKPAWAAVAGVSAPFAGFCLFFEQPSWVTSLIGMAWVLQAWASGVRYARGRSNAIPMFVFLFLAITVGYVHAALMAGMAVGCLVIGEGLYQRNWWPSLRLAIAGASAAACGAITYLPGVLTSDVTWRTGEEGTRNTNFLTAPWSETITASIPSSVTSIESWSGETTVAPITYIAWFAIPVLAFVAWRQVVPALRELSALIIALVLMLLFTAGPSDIGQIRWPARLLPVVAELALILIVVIVSRFGTFKQLRARLVAAGLITLVLVLRAASSGPQFMGRHLLAGIFVAVAGGLAVFLARRFGVRAVSAFLMVTVVPIALYQVSTFPQPLTKWHFPTSQSQAKAGFPDFPGTTLQLGDRGLAGSSGINYAPLWHGQVYGNYAKDLNLTYVNAYTPVGHQTFSALLCMKYDGSTCKDAYGNLFKKDLYTQRTFADLMKLDRVTLQRKQYKGIDNTPPPPGWHWVQTTPDAAKQIAVLERVDGLVSTKPGRVTATVNADAIPISSSANHEKVRVSSVPGGSVVFARLAWPGYTASLNGQPLQTKGLGKTFLYVDLPPGTQNAELDINFRPPGQKLGFVGIGGGIVAFLALLVFDVRRRRVNKLK